MRNDVVVAFERRARGENVGLFEDDVLQPERRDCAPSLRDGGRAQVEPQERAPRIGLGEGNEVAAAAAAEFEHAAGVRRRRLKSAQPCQDFAVRGMRLRKGGGRIRHLVVGRVGGKRMIEGRGGLGGRRGGHGDDP